MTLAEFEAGTWRVHSLYRESILAPIAPEYTTGEVLLAGAYRKLWLGLADATIDLDDVNRLPDRMSPSET